MDCRSGFSQQGSVTEVIQSKDHAPRAKDRRHPEEKPTFSRINRPADLYLNRECMDANGYYIEQNNLVAL
jgi:hypothetical protein